MEGCWKPQRFPGKDRQAVENWESWMKNTGDSLFLFRTVSARWIQHLAGKRYFATEFRTAQMGILHRLVHVMEGGKSSDVLQEGSTRPWSGGHGLKVTYWLRPEKLSG